MGTRLTPPIVLISVSIPLILKMIPRNRMYGFRVPKTLASDAVWYPANQVSGVALLAAGIVWAAAAMGAVPQRYATATGVTAVGVAVAVGEACVAVGVGVTVAVGGAVGEAVSDGTCCAGGGSSSSPLSGPLVKRITPPTAAPATAAPEAARMAVSASGVIAHPPTCNDR